jgi:hypothetical protein
VNRRELGRGKLIIVSGAAIALAATVLPWYTVGGTVLPATSANAFAGAGIAVFVAAICLLALVALPYATRDGRVAVDRPMSYLLVAGLGIAGYLLRVVQLSAMNALGFPDRAPGLWLAGVGLLIVGWGVAEVLAEPTPL